MLFLAFGVARRWILPLAASVTLVIHYAFYSLLRVPLPWGVLEASPGRARPRGSSVSFSIRCVLGVVLASAIFGLFVGSIPGLTATMAVALLVPVTFFLPPLPAVACMVTATAMAIFAGDVPARCSGCRAHPRQPPTATKPTR